MDKENNLLNLEASIVNSANNELISTNFLQASHNEIVTFFFVPNATVWVAIHLPIYDDNEQIQAILNNDERILGRVETSLANFVGTLTIAENREPPTNRAIAQFVGRMPEGHRLDVFYPTGMHILTKKDQPEGQNFFYGGTVGELGIIHLNWLDFGDPYTVRGMFFHDNEMFSYDSIGHEFRELQGDWRADTLKYFYDVPNDIANQL